MRAVRPAAVVEREIARDRGSRLAHRLIGPQVHLLVLQRLPEPLDEHVVAPAALAVHADGNAVALEQRDEFHASELAALVGVHDLGHPVALDRLLDRLDAEVRRQGVREPERENLAARPVHHRHQVHEPTAHRNVGDIERPDVIRFLDRDIPEQVRVNLMSRRATAGRFPPDQRLDPHPRHQRADMLAARIEAFGPEQIAQRPGAREGVLQVQLVDPAHQRQVRLRHRPRRVVHRGP